MALPRANRLSLRTHRTRLTQTGHSFYGRFFTVIFSYQDTSSVPRFAILVSKKTALLASDRNRIKRIVSSVIQSLFPLPVGDYLLIPKRQVLQAKFTDLQKDISTLVQR